MRVRIPKGNDKGNGLLTTMILILVMMVIVVGSLSIAGLQSDISNINKEKSNTYTLAESAIEKTVDSINKEIELATNDIMEQVRKDTLTTINTYMSTVEANKNYADPSDPDSSDHGINQFLKYVDHAEGAETDATTRVGDFGSSNNKIKFKNQATIREAILKTVQKKILIKDGSNFKPKQITYDIKSDYTYDVKDNQNEGNITRVTATISQPNPSKLEEYAIHAVAQVLDSSGNVIESQQVAKAIVEISLPNRIDSYISERYEWFDNPAEILSGAIMSYNPLTISKGTIEVTGDVKVTGERTDPAVLEETAEIIPLVKNSRGVLAKGGTLTVHGNLYCASNVASTGGTIDVDGDVIADTLAIFDNYYPSGSTEGSDEPWLNMTTGTITVGKNAFVENDVAIERYVNNGKIEVKNSIYGIMNADNTYSKTKTLADGSKVTLVDPNRSSGVFNRGQGTSKIIAKNVFVNGQPYINFGDGNGYHELHESIGEPYEYLLPFPEYKQKYGSTDKYLTESPEKDEIKKDSIIIGETIAGGGVNPGNIFAHRYVSANGAIVNNKRDILGDPTDAINFFFMGGASIPSGLGDDFAGYEYLWEESNYANFYAADTALATKKDFYAKKMTSPDAGGASPTEHDGVEYFAGVRAVMTARRSPLYKAYDAIVRDFELMDFGSATNLDYFSSTREWTLANPLVVTNGAGVELDIAQYYVDGTPYPTVIISHGDIQLKTSDPVNKKEFHGVIVCAGKVTINNNIKVKGTMVLGGGIELKENSTKLEVVYDPNAIFGANYADKEVFRYILDSLNITKFYKSGGGNIANALNAFDPDGLGYTYTMPRVKLTDMHLTVETQTIMAKIKEIEKIQN